MGKRGRAYAASGFREIRSNSGCSSYHKLPVAASTTITKGDFVGIVAGYASGLTAFSTLGQGVAVETVDNSSGSAGDLYVLVQPIDQDQQYLVPIAEDALVTQAAVGLRVDLEAAGTIDISDTTVVGFGFQIEEIDASAEAVAVNTYGYAIGRIISV